MQAAFEKQIAWCASLGSGFTARLLGHLLADLRAGGPVAALVGAWPGDPVADAVPLRLAGGLHALVLAGQVPVLAACYPPEAEADGLGDALDSVLAVHTEYLRAFIASPPQTNEVGRSAVLLGGFLEVAAATGLPLRLLEIGASAGLNMIWDRFRYRLGDAAWGDADSPVLLTPLWEGGLPPLAAPLRVAERAGCDVAPIDLRRPESRLRLRAYTWPDQPERLARLEHAMALAITEAGDVRHPVERADASDWLRAALAAPAPGRATVVYHSIMWSYLPGPTQAAVRDSLAQAGARATTAAPLAWLRFEPPRPETRPELHLSLWPGEPDRRLAIAGPHGTTVSWL